MFALKNGQQILMSLSATVTCVNPKVLIFEIIESLLPDSLNSFCGFPQQRLYSPGTVPKLFEVINVYAINTLFDLL
jgi:hypothetical protein